jgi:hypothetical protein
MISAWRLAQGAAVVYRLERRRISQARLFADIMGRVTRFDAGTDFDKTRTGNESTSPPPDYRPGSPAGKSTARVARALDPRGVPSTGSAGRRVSRCIDGYETLWVPETLHLSRHLVRLACHSSGDCRGVACRVPGAAGAWPAVLICAEHGGGLPLVDHQVAVEELASMPRPQSLTAVATR